MKKIFCLILTLLLFTMVLFGCGTTEENKTETTAEAADQTEAIEETDAKTYDSSKWKFAFLICNAEMRSSAHQALWTGASKFAAETGISIKWYSAELPDVANTVVDQIVSDGYNVIVNASSTVSQKLVEKAKQYPDVLFVNTEYQVDAEGVSNYINALVKAEDSTYLAGYIAGYRTTTNIIGYVGGTDNFTSQQLESGFIAGVKQAAKDFDKDLKPMKDYVGTGYDRNGGYDTAKEQYDKGADVIFIAVTGETGSGAIWAAKELNKECITMGNQNYIAPDNIIASVKKSLDANIYDVCMGVVTKELTGGNNYSYNITSEKAGLIKNAETTDFLGEEFMSKLDKIIEQLNNNEIEIKLNELAKDWSEYVS